MPQIQTDDTGGLEFPQKLPQLPKDGTELYDSIMQIVEPELVTSELPRIHEHLRKEGPEKAKAHAKRYAVAFEKFHSILEQSQGAMRNEVKSFAHSAYASLEKLAGSIDQDRMIEIDKELTKSKEVKQKSIEEISEDTKPDPNIS